MYENAGGGLVDMDPLFCAHQKKTERLRCCEPFLQPSSIHDHFRLPSNFYIVKLAMSNLSVFLYPDSFQTRGFLGEVFIKQVVFVCAAVGQEAVTTGRIFTVDISDPGVILQALFK